MSDINFKNEIKKDAINKGYDFLVGEIQRIRNNLQWIIITYITILCSLAYYFQICYSLKDDIKISSNINLIKSNGNDIFIFLLLGIFLLVTILLIVTYIIIITYAFYKLQKSIYHKILKNTYSMIICNDVLKGIYNYYIYDEEKRLPYFFIFINLIIALSPLFLLFLRFGHHEPYYFIYLLIISFLFIIYPNVCRKYYIIIKISTNILNGAIEVNNNGLTYKKETYKNINKLIYIMNKEIENVNDIMYFENYLKFKNEIANSQNALNDVCDNVPKTDTSPKKDKTKLFIDKNKYKWFKYRMIFIFFLQIILTVIYNIYYNNLSNIGNYFFYLSNALFMASIIIFSYSYWGKMALITSLNKCINQINHNADSNYIKIKLLFLNFLLANHIYYTKNKNHDVNTAEPTLKK